MTIVLIHPPPPQAQELQKSPGGIGLTIRTRAGGFYENTVIASVLIVLV